MTTDTRAVEQALAGLRVAYQADGYDLLVDSVEDGRATIRIAAGPEACEECLVSKQVAVMTLHASLRGLPEIRSIDLVYPTDK